MIRKVASFTDAWIETIRKPEKSITRRSHLLQMRGLKQIKSPVSRNVTRFVASFTDAWIETNSGVANSFSNCRIFYRCVDWNWGNEIDATIYRVASFTDAWIETVITSKFNEYASVASFTDAWIETVDVAYMVAYNRSHLLQMRGLKPNGYPTTGRRNRRIFYRCVDWNRWDFEPIRTRSCRIFYRCVDWNQSLPAWYTGNQSSHLLQMRGLKLMLRANPPNRASRIFYRCVDWNDNQQTIPVYMRVASFTDAWIETAIAYAHIAV